MSSPTKTALITGTSSGIGKALAIELHSQGWRVLATARSVKSIDDLAQLGVTPLALDVDQPESIAALKIEVDRITSGRLDLLINNAGRNYTMPALDITHVAALATFSTNVHGPMLTTQAFAPLLIAAHGTIVQIGSVAASIPYAFNAVYNASKAALLAYSSTLRVELAPLGVRVVVVLTGGVKSNIARVPAVLPQGSYYLPVREEFERCMQDSQAKAMEARVYAKSVVREVTKPRLAREVWEGFGASMAYYICTFLPASFWDSYMRREFNLEKLQKAHEE